MRTFAEADGLPSTHVLAITAAPDGVTWVGTRTGIATYDGTR